MTMADVKRNIKLDAKLALARELDSRPPPPPDGRFDVVVVDPPWKYSNRVEDATHRARNPYPDMSVDEICKLPVQTLAEPDCVLWLWTTNAFMRQAFVVLDAWGFSEKTILHGARTSSALATGSEDKPSTASWLCKANPYKTSRVHPKSPNSGYYAQCRNSSPN
jgi:hypothetical protein